MGALGACHGVAAGEVALLGVDTLRFEEPGRLGTYGGAGGV